MLQDELWAASLALASDAQTLEAIRVNATPRELAYIVRVLRNMRSTQEAITDLNGPPDVTYDEHCYGHVDCWALWVLCDESNWDCHDRNFGLCLWGTCRYMHGQ